MEKLISKDIISARIIRSAKMFDESSKVSGTYLTKCVDADGNVKWEDKIENIVVTVGANLMLDQMFEAVGGTVNSTHFISLISSVGYTTGAANGDTMASHAGWYEAGDATYLPTWSTPASNGRATITWTAATGRSKSTNGYSSFVMTTGGTIKGCFIVTGSGAVATRGDPNGVLYSAGLFSGGDKTVGAGDTVQVFYTTTLS